MNNINTPLLTAKNISMSFKKNIHAFMNISFTIHPGEIIGLLGDNGAGKSTLIKTLNGCYQPTAGSLLFQNNPLIWRHQQGPKQARQLGIHTVDQDLGLIDTLSLYRNFFLGNELKYSWGLLQCLKHKAMADITQQELTDIGIKKSLNPYNTVAKLSGGERQALAIMKAIHFKSKLLIFDEPTSALSTKQTQEVLHYIRKAATHHIAVIIITHRLTDLTHLVDRYMVLHQGRLVGDITNNDVDEQQLQQLILKGKPLNDTKK